MKQRVGVILLSAFWGLFSSLLWAQNALVLQSDFGTKDGAVAAMKGVAFGVSPSLPIFDLTHEIPSFNVWEAAQRLDQTAKYWPPGTVFVSVVDPGVGTQRKSVVLKTKSGHYFVTPDNGTLTFVAQTLGIAAVREIDEKVNRLQNSEQSYTFHGRDVYAFTGARLAAGVISFAEVGPELPARVVSIPYQKAKFENGVVYGNIPILDVQFGNVWTNIDRSVFSQLGVKVGAEVRVKISHADKIAFDGKVPYVRTFGDVEIGQPLLYFNSLNKVALALNQGSFAQQHQVKSGPEWQVQIRRNERF
ncbi:MAG: S-adenosyl-l-methionine hydroxide adenosyltransferase family protein [bacterium]